MGSGVDLGRFLRFWVGLVIKCIPTGIYHNKYVQVDLACITDKITSIITYNAIS